MPREKQMKNLNIWIALMALGTFALVGCTPDGTAMEGDQSFQETTPMGDQPTTDLDPNTGAAPGTSPEMGY